MTPKMKKALDFISHFISENGYSPSYVEIKESLGLKSISGIHRLVHGLAERKKIEIMGNKSRAIRLVSLCECPKCGFQWNNATSDMTGNVNQFPIANANGYAIGAEK